MKNNKEEVYYHGRAHDNAKIEDVMRRHSKNVGVDGARFGVGDSIHRTTPIGTNYNTVRGIEHNGTQTDGVLGRGTGKVRGNIDHGISSKNKNIKDYVSSATKYLEKMGVKSVGELKPLLSKTFEEWKGTGDKC